MCDDVEKNYKPGGPVIAHEFTEDADDYSMCICGVPALTHDQVYPPDEPRCNPVGGVHALWCPDRVIPPEGTSDG